MRGVTDYRFVLLHGVGGSTFAFLIKLSADIPARREAGFGRG
jgi:hypothetical protein